MTLANICAMARLRPDVIALTDHNTGGNLTACEEAARREDRSSSRHGIVRQRGSPLTGLLSDVGSAMKMDAAIRPLYPAEKNRPDYFGRQLLADSQDQALGRGRPAYRRAGSGHHSAIWDGSSLWRRHRSGAHPQGLRPHPGAGFYARKPPFPRGGGVPGARNPPRPPAGLLLGRPSTGHDLRTRPRPARPAGHHGLAQNPRQGVNRQGRPYINNKEGSTSW